MLQIPSWVEERLANSWVVCVLKIIIQFLQGWICQFSGNDARASASLEWVSVIMRVESGLHFHPPVSSSLYMIVYHCIAHCRRQNTKERYEIEGVISSIRRTRWLYTVPRVWLAVERISGKTVNLEKEQKSCDDPYIIDMMNIFLAATSLIL